MTFRSKPLANSRGRAGALPLRQEDLFVLPVSFLGCLVQHRVLTRNGGDGVYPRNRSMKWRSFVVRDPFHWGRPLHRCVAKRAFESTVLCDAGDGVVYMPHDLQFH